MTLRERFGANLRKVRGEKDFTQEELSFRCGLHRTTISLYEHGKREPRLAVIVKLAKGLDVPTEALCDGIEWLPESKRFRIEAEEPG